MRKLIVSTFLSLDGVMQSPGGPEEDTSGGFQLGGWCVPLSDETTRAAILEIYGRLFDLVLGRKTYDIWATYWPHQPDDNPIARAINTARKHVASRGRPKLDWRNSQLLGEDVVASLRTLKSQDGPDLFVPGSSDLLQTLWKASLVDAFSVLIYPVILGRGKRLFGDGATPAGLKLTRSQTSSTGVTLAWYEVEGPVRTGSFGLPKPAA